MIWTLAALYKFLDLPDCKDLRPDLQSYCDAHGLCGILLLAGEGINGTVAGSEVAVRDLLTHLETSLGLGPIEVKYSSSEEKPFRKMKVRLTTEIVRLGRPDLRPDTHPVGTYVDPADWNRLISDPDVRLIDTRNDFECRVGSFEGAENPHTETFGEFPDYVKQNLNPARDKRVAMFCTGGIRCEKATAYLLEQGFEEVYHLRGGILKYFEEVPEADSLWNGECFVFDDRVTVDQNLHPGETECCRGCWNPLRPEDKQDPRYEEGVSCPLCRDVKTEKQLAGARERERQRLLAEARAAS